MHTFSIQYEYLGSTGTVDLKFSPATGDRWELFTMLGKTEHSIISFDCHEAFNELRIKLGEDFIFMCNGACPNFLLSPMLSQSGGLYGYKIPEIRKAQNSDVVQTFGHAFKSEIGTVEQQKQYKDNYFKLIENGTI